MFKFIKIKNSNVQSKGVGWIRRLGSTNIVDIVYQISEDHYYVGFDFLDNF